MSTSAFIKDFIDAFVTHPSYGILQDQVLQCLLDHDGQSVDDPRERLRDYRYTCARECLDILGEMAKRDENRGNILNALQSDWYGLHLAADLFEAGRADPAIVRYASKACAETATRVSANGMMERERCMAALAAMESDPLPAQASHRIVFGDTFLAHSARAQVLVGWASSHPEATLRLLENSIRTESDLTTLYEWPEHTNSWRQYPMARSYARMFHWRVLRHREAGELCDEMIAGLAALPSSAERNEHMMVYNVLRDRLRGSLSPLPKLDVRDGYIPESHELAFKLLRRADSSPSAEYLWDCHYDRRGWLESYNHAIRDGELSFGSGVYLIYIFPAVRLAASIYGRRIGVTAPAAILMRSRLAGQELLHNTQFRSRFLEPAERLRELVDPLMEHAAGNPRDERVWATIGNIRLRLGELNEAEAALQTSLGIPWGNGATRRSAFYDLACVYARRSDETSCHVALESWSKLGPDGREMKYAKDEDDDLAVVRDSDWFRERLLDDHAPAEAG